MAISPSRKWLRAGCITALARSAVHEQDIMQHSPHASHSAMRGYIRAAVTEDAIKSKALWQAKEG